MILYFNLKYFYIKKILILDKETFDNILFIVFIIDIFIISDVYLGLFYSELIFLKKTLVLVILFR